MYKYTGCMHKLRNKWNKRCFFLYCLVNSYAAKIVSAMEKITIISWMYIILLKKRNAFHHELCMQKYLLTKICLLPINTWSNSWMIDPFFFFVGDDRSIGNSTSTFARNLRIIIYFFYFIQYYKTFSLDFFINLNANEIILINFNFLIILKNLLIILLYIILYILFKEYFIFQFKDTDWIDIFNEKNTRYFTYKFIWYF